jgi:hypothetical protein
MRTVVAVVAITFTFCGVATAQGQRQQGAPAAPPTLAPEAAAALEQLEPRYAAEMSLTPGWFRDRNVLYYDFGSVPIGASAGRVLWPIHGFDAKGNPVAIRGQRPIFSTIPGLAEYSGVYRLSYVVTADHVQPNILRDIAAVDELVRRGRALIRETDMTYNLPIVPRGTRLARDTSQGMPGWYEGREVQFFDFGPASITPAPMWRFVRGADASGQPAILAEQNSVVDSVPTSGMYPDLWEIHPVQADSAYVANAVKDASALRSGGFAIGTPNAVRNLPIAFVDGSIVPRTPSPVRAFADLRSPFPPAPTRPLVTQQP